MTESNIDVIKPEQLLQRLIRFNTTNPPGNEADCIIYISKLLEQSGIETILVGKQKERPNLIARLRGKGNKPAFMMYGHADVVTVNNQDWKYPPFEGIIAEDCVWGRGALDMKGALAMMLCALLRLKAEGTSPEGDIIFCVVSDEEADGHYGAEYLAENHADLFKGIKYAIGETGGFSMDIMGKRFYPVMIAEKQICRLKMTFRGSGGHGSMIMRNGAMSKLGKVLETLNKKRLPVHITPSVKMMIEAWAAAMPFPASVLMKCLLNPVLTDCILNIMGETGSLLEPLFHNTINATIVRGGDKINVIPSEIVLELDGRMLPGFEKNKFLVEAARLVGSSVQIEPISFSKGPSEPDMGLFDTLSGILKEKDPSGIPIPFVASGVTDARFFSRLGIQTYGFTPMLLPKGFDFSKLLHNANERLPVEALYFGTDSIYNLLRKIMC